jgi:hypothetical protein
MRPIYKATLQISLIDIQERIIEFFDAELVFATQLDDPAPPAFERPTEVETRQTALSFLEDLR